LTVLIPHFELLLVLADEPQELHQGTLRLEVDIVVLENVLSSVRHLEKFSRWCTAFRHQGFIPSIGRVHPPATDSEELELTVHSGRDEVLKERRAGIYDLRAERQAVCPRLRECRPRAVRFRSIGFGNGDI
jgi:hypothetical protein